MPKRLAAVLAAALGAGTLAAGAAPAASAAPAEPAASAPAAERTAARDAAEAGFTGIVALGNCSGSLVRGPRSRDTDAALVLTNGHCLETGMPRAGEVVVDRRSSRRFTLLDRTGRGDLGELRATRIEYATMTGTDVAVYRLNTTYARIERAYGTPALRLSTARPHAGTPIQVVSGYWRTVHHCKIDAMVHRLREAGWTWRDSIRYTPQCQMVPGTSGSPVIDVRTRQVVGVNNTGNENGERCTLNNPCEVDGRGGVTVRHGTHYGQQTYLLARCLGGGNDVVLGGSCRLPRP